MFAVLWWTLFTLVCIWLNGFVPGVDFFAPGLVVLLQEDKAGRAIVPALAWTLITEGTGGLAFGYGLAWYGSLVLLYFFGRWLFEARNFLFMCLLGLLLGLLHVGLAMAMASLQDLVVDPRRLVGEGILQALVFPVQWVLVSKLYPDRLKHVPVA